MTTKHCTLLYLVKGDAVLLAQKKRGFGAGWWNGVGGKIEADETIEDALVRECIEEIGCTPITYTKVAEHHFLQNDTEPWHMHVHVYICDTWNGEPAETEEMAPQWFDQNSVPYEQMWESDAYWLPRIFAGEHVRGDFSFDKDNHVLSHSVVEAEDI